MSLTPRQREQALTQAQPRVGKSPIASRTNPSNPTRTSYTSFPSSSSVSRDRAASAAFDARKTAEEPKQARKGLCVSLATLLGAAPALLGMCCWPSLLAAILGGAVTGGAREVSHTLSLIFTAVTCTLLVGYLAWCTRERAQLHATGTEIYGPFLLMCFASLLVLADPIRHVLQDEGIWAGESSNAFKDGCGEGWVCLTTTGILFMIVFTYLGFALLFTANFWNANLPAKIKQFAAQWKEIRAERAAAKLAQKEAKRAAEVEAERAAREELERRPSSLNFGSLHLSMQPPAIFFRKEEANKIGYRVPAPKPADPGLPSNLDAHIQKREEYSSAGYSYEVVTGVRENVISVPKNMREAAQVPEAASPTVTSSPSSQSFTSPQNNSISPSSMIGFTSPLSNVHLTPIHTNSLSPQKAKEMEEMEKGRLQYMPEGRTEMIAQ
jgi:hypothetical protein